MDFSYCSNCGKKTGHKRFLGFGTFFAVVLTAGVWILAIPFYPKRCIICGQEQEIESAGFFSRTIDLSTHQKPWYKSWWGISLILMLIVVLFGLYLRIYQG
ncbi:hypothetical protein DRH29_05420 [candidate division Kazan bacterium]|uniref:LITAF domain-containing protein n=1 Tax=candidate division Kazan bacterium TaxID=2202143 RepID=A0A420ZB82_UNCK3|nr:MAG: hypothetical protein DRH29_05420 [candidate division Kazan bacterium]